MPLIDDNDRARISAAIADAERTTSGEIVAIIATESDNYLWLPFLAAGSVALLVPWPLIYSTWMPVQWIYLIQLLVYLAVFLVLLHRPLRFALVPRAMRDAAAHRRAVEQFLAQSLHTSEGRTGVLLFASFAERYAEIIADTAAHERIGKDVWQRIVDDLTGALAHNRVGDGFVAAIAAIGETLAREFPPGSANPDELPDHLIVLE